MRQREYLWVDGATLCSRVEYLLTSCNVLTQGYSETSQAEREVRASESVFKLIAVQMFKCVNLNTFPQRKKACNLCRARASLVGGGTRVDSRLATHAFCTAAKHLLIKPVALIFQLVLLALSPETLTAPTYVRRISACAYDFVSTFLCTQSKYKAHHSGGAC